MKMTAAAPVKLRMQLLDHRELHRPNNDGDDPDDSWQSQVISRSRKYTGHMINDDPEVRDCKRRPTLDRRDEEKEQPHEHAEDQAIDTPADDQSREADKCRLVPERRSEPRGREHQRPQHDPERHRDNDNVVTKVLAPRPQKERRERESRAEPLDTGDPAGGKPCVAIRIDRIRLHRIQPEILPHERGERRDEQPALPGARAEIKPSDFAQCRPDPSEIEFPNRRRPEFQSEPETDSLVQLQDST